MWRGAGKLLPYLENLRDQFSLPMVYVSHQFEEVLRLAGDVVVLDNGAVAGPRRCRHDEPVPGAARHHRRRVSRRGGGRRRSRRSMPPLTWRGSASAPGSCWWNPGTCAAASGVRVQLLARDLILAIAPPTGLSVRNCLAGHHHAAAAGRDRVPGWSSPRPAVRPSWCASRMRRAAPSPCRWVSGYGCWSRLFRCAATFFRRHRPPRRHRRDRRRHARLQQPVQLLGGRGRCGAVRSRETPATTCLPKGVMWAPPPPAPPTLAVVTG